MSPRLHAQLVREPYLASDPEARTIFYRDGKARPVGARITNLEYAATLRSIGKDGADAFYRYLP